jgi:Phage integrase family
VVLSGGNLDIGSRGGKSATTCTTPMCKAPSSRRHHGRVPKRVSPQTFRHTFASHLLLAHYDIQTIQKLFGHSDVKTTMIYPQPMPSVTAQGGSEPDGSWRMTTGQICLCGFLLMQSKDTGAVPSTRRAIFEEKDRSIG